MYHMWTLNKADNRILVIYDLFKDNQYQQLLKKMHRNRPKVK